MFVAPCSWRSVRRLRPAPRQARKLKPALAAEETRRAGLAGRRQRSWPQVVPLKAIAVRARKESDTGRKRTRGEGLHEQSNSFGLRRRGNPWFGGIGLGGRCACRRDCRDAPCRKRQGCQDGPDGDRKSTRLNSSHSQISYAVFCLKKK